MWAAREFSSRATPSAACTDDKTAVKLGSLELSVKEKKTVSVPVWAGVGAIVAGGLLLVLGGQKR